MKIKNKFLSSLFSSTLSILPIIVIIYILSLSGLTPIDQSSKHIESITLAIGAIIMILGLSLFQIGSANSLSKVGEYMGASLSKQKKLIIVIVFSLTLGALITCAEPSIMIISTQVKIDRWLLIGLIATGVGIFVVIGVLRIFFGKSLKLWYLLFYFITFAIICVLQVNEKLHPYLPFVFDAGGITTGSATVPFILALGAGAASVRGGRKSMEDSFGLVGMASIGPIIAMAILIILTNNGNSGFQEYTLDTWTTEGIGTRLLQSLIYTSPTSMGSTIDVALAIAPIIAVFTIYDRIFIKLPKKEIGRLAIGFVFAYVGLTLFLTGVNASMGPVGNAVGSGLASRGLIAMFAIAFLLGLVTILCEPAVHSLTTQIVDVSAGTIRKAVVLATLSLGVGIAVLLSTIRNWYGFSIMYYMVPGYVIALVLMFFTPNLFVAISFDSGGTASGPMSVSFVVPMMIGITSYRHAITPSQLADPSYLEKIGHKASDFAETAKGGLYYLERGNEFYQDSFGLVAMIALLPILAIEILGIFSQTKINQKFKIMRSLVHDKSNARIINL